MAGVADMSGEKARSPAGPGGEYPRQTEGHRAGAAWDTAAPRAGRTGWSSGQTDRSCVDAPGHASFPGWSWWGFILRAMTHPRMAPRGGPAPCDVHFGKIIQSFWLWCGRVNRGPWGDKTGDRESHTVLGAGVPPSLGRTRLRVEAGPGGGEARGTVT